MKDNSIIKEMLKEIGYLMRSKSTSRSVDGKTEMYIIYNIVKN